VWTLVVGAHVLVVFVLSREQAAATRRAEPLENEALLLIELGPDSSVDQVLPARVKARKRLAAPRESDRPQAPPEPPTTEPVARTEPPVDDTDNRIESTVPGVEDCVGAPAPGTTPPE
jgi:hypothetical protein